jgi:GxxExxY protein
MQSGDINKITSIVIQECIQIHRDLGPGLLESVYEEILCYRLKESGLSLTRQTPVSVYYDGIDMGIGFKADFIVEDCVIVELKSVEIIPPFYHKKLLTYLRLANKKVGLLINFNESLLKNGIKRIVNNL